MSWQGDSLVDNVTIVDFWNWKSVKSTMYVLPGVNPLAEEGLHWKNGEFIRDDEMENNYFLIVPPVSGWSKVKED